MQYKKILKESIRKLVNWIKENWMLLASLALVLFLLTRL